MEKTKFKKLTSAYNLGAGVNQTKSVWFNRATIEKLLSQSNTDEGGIKIFFGKYDSETQPVLLPNGSAANFSDKFTAIMCSNNHKIHLQDGLVNLPDKIDDHTIIEPNSKVSLFKFNKLINTFANHWGSEIQSRSITFSKNAVEHILNQSDPIDGGLKIYFAQYESETIPSDVEPNLKNKYLGKVTVVIAASNHNTDPVELIKYRNGGQLCPPHCGGGTDDPPGFKINHNEKFVAELMEV